MTIVTSMTPRTPSLMASSLPYESEQMLPTKALPKPAATLLSSPPACEPAKSRYTAYGTGQKTSRCPPPSNIMGDDSTLRYPPTRVQALLPNGSKSWGTVRLLLGQESTLMSWNTWSHYSSLSITHSNPPLPCHSGLWNCSNLREAPFIPWLKRPVASNTPLPMPKSNDTTITMNDKQNWKSTAGPSWLKLSRKTMPKRASNTAWRCTDSINASPTSKATLTSIRSSPLKTSLHAGKTLATTTMVDQKVHSEKEVMLPPEQVAQLLPWYI